MSKLIVFNNISLDGYIADESGSMSWAHANADDPEWAAFGAENVKGEGVMLFGRTTYELMAGFWPTPQARASAPAIAERMNDGLKVVFSRTLEKASWNNTRLVKSDLLGEVRKMKSGSGPDMAVMGSGSIVAQLAAEGLIDELTMVVVPVVLGAGKTMFEGVKKHLPMKHTKTRTFANGRVVLTYQPT